MFGHLKNGFKTTASQTFVLLVLWMYHFAWGFVLLLYVKSIVDPLLHRFPGEHLATSASHLFMAEAQFRLMKTDISYAPLWLLLGFAGARMLLTPLLNAGVYYSLHNPHMNSGYRFFQGIRRLGRPFLGYYAAQTILTLAPLYWLYPIVYGALGKHGDYLSLGLALLPWVAGYALYGFLLRLVFMYIQLGKTSEQSLGQSLGLLLRKLPLIAAAAVTLLALSGIVTAAALSASLIWAGISAILLQQLFHIVSMMFKLWGIATQYHVYAGDAD
ncbi:hypothetical protein [Paenibacillus ginsengarvi]|uniref:DUF975 family protein n=1 Tax=Paenibacillus ginsengarvi TaxID=400777 RepID=A0A3B0CK08_9BACL|nr:hypothetical protein [Paenibacillus ginsengarvi]RKN85733.1 hypothetical protein D7M11_05150 [Paenibacillus ginsengarvi]